MLAALRFKTFSESISDIVINPSSLDSPQSRCLTKYLTELGTKSYIIEKKYTDAGFLVDFSHYYSRCHTHYERTAHRIHFFKEIAPELNIRFKDWIDTGHGVEEFNELYLGFVVVKPLPQTIIGRTCLKTYDKIDSKSSRNRIFPILRTYTSTLHGIPLSVKSIAFQEQDKEIAACATAAIWFALHGMTKKITTQEIVSPFEITNVSTKTYIKRSQGDVTRSFPSAGLGLEQIESYLRQYGVECIVCGIMPNDVNDKLQNYLASYVHGGYPMIVVGDMYGSSIKDAEFKLMGLHAITALGYAESQHFERNNHSKRIHRLFAHDDNVGPFTSFHFNTCKNGEFTKFLQTKNSNESEEVIKTAIENISQPALEDAITAYLENQSGLSKSGYAFRKYIPKYLIIPVNQKIRLPYEIVLTVAKQFDVAYEKRKHIWFGNNKAPSCAWSINLMEASDVQSELASCKTITRDEDFLSLLCMPMPKYIWRLRFTTKLDALTDEIVWVDALLDATDLLQGGGVLAIFAHDKNTHADGFMSTLMQCVKEWIEKYPHEIEPGAMPIMQTLYKHCGL